MRFTLFLQRVSYPKMNFSQIKGWNFPLLWNICLLKQKLLSLEFSLRLHSRIIGWAIPRFMDNQGTWHFSLGAWTAAVEVTPWYLGVMLLTSDLLIERQNYLQKFQCNAENAVLEGERKGVFCWKVHGKTCKKTGIIISSALLRHHQAQVLLHHRSSK